MKPIEELTFTDDYVFGQIMKNPEICKGVLERLLHKKITRLVYPELQKAIQPYYTTKGVRLDVYVEGESEVYDIEMQNQCFNTLGLRTRYYNSMMDVDALMKGADYTALKHNIIIFICKTDPFEVGLPKYSFTTQCTENKNVCLNDRSTKLIFNASAYEKESDPELYSFLQFICSNKPDDTFTNQVYNSVENLKEQNLFKSEYMRMNIHDWDKIHEGLKQGKKEAKLEDAIIAVKEFNIAPELVAEKYSVDLEILKKALKERK